MERVPPSQTRGNRIVSGMRALAGPGRQEEGPSVPDRGAFA